MVANLTMNTPAGTSQLTVPVASQDLSGSSIPSSSASFLDFLLGMQSTISEGGAQAKEETKHQDGNDLSSWLALLQMLTQQGWGGAQPAPALDNVNNGAASLGEESPRGNTAGPNVLPLLSSLFGRINPDSASGQTAQALSESNLEKIKEFLQRVLSSAPALDNQEQQKLFTLLQRGRQEAHQGAVTSADHAGDGLVMGQQTLGQGSWAAVPNGMANPIFKGSFSPFQTRLSPGDRSPSGPFGSLGSSQMIETSSSALGNTAITSDHSASYPPSQAMGPLPLHDRNDSFAQGVSSSAFALYHALSASGQGSSPSSQSTGQVEASRLAQQLPEQVIQRAQWLQRGGTATFQLTLVPDGLGQIHVAVERDAQAQVSLLLSADTLQAHQLLDSQLSALRLQLEQQGLQVRDLKVLTPQQMQMHLGMGGGFLQQQPRENPWNSPSSAEPGGGYQLGEPSSATGVRERDRVVFARWSTQEENAYRSDNQIDFRA